MFTISFDSEKKGRFVKITEQHGRSVFELSIEETGAVCIVDAFEDLLVFVDPEVLQKNKV